MTLSERLEAANLMNIETEANNYDCWAEHYDFSMGDRSAHINFYSGLLTNAMRAIVDIGCGSGVIIEALSKRLHQLTGISQIRVVGLDSSQEMLRRAKQRNANIDWILGDLRSFRVDGKFDLAICCYNTLQHVDSAGLAQAFRSIRSVLHLGGTFAFDIYQPNIAYVRVPQYNRLARALIDEEGRRLEIREDSSYDDHAKLLTLEWRLVREGIPLEPPLAQIRYEMWQHFPEDVDRALSIAGFAVRERYGQLDKAPFDRLSKKQVVVCSAV